ncbi:helix-turn-helix domain-containing protein [Dyadobacter sp. BHUBP1]|uniref:helix-turn-helix domain-containing protein n=1 Tax=Dyadobacter sp. BHUBP1 TaxID=3424178 RepID=UPI003D340F47
MILRDIRPHPGLREFIRCYRLVHFEFAQDDLIPVKTYPPKPEQILHFFLHDFFAVQKQNGPIQRQPAMMLAGQRSFVTNQYNGCHFIDVQIVFQPTAVFQLTGIPADQLTDQHLDATLIFTSGIKETFQRLQEATNYSELVIIIEAFAIELFKRIRFERPALTVVSQRLIETAGGGNLTQWASEACLSTRQFKRKFLESTGVNPKTYARIVRFNRAFNLRNRYALLDWLSIAVLCGYYDYQHLSKDYQDFTGLTPIEFHRLEGLSPEKQLGLTDSLYLTRAEMSI